MIKTIIIAIISLAAVFTASGQACDTISLPDTLYACPGNRDTLRAVLSGPNSSVSTLWSPATGLSSTTVLDPALTVSTSRWYTVSVESLIPDNIVVNGDFSAGNTGFTSSYNYITAMDGDNPDDYEIGTDPDFFNTGWPVMGDHTTGTGNMLCVDGDNLLAGVSFWCESLTVIPGTNYVFTVWSALLASPQPTVQVQINGTTVGTFVTSTTVGRWTEYTVTWNSGTATTADICLSDLNTVYGGNDFALDDISFNGTCTTKDSIYVDATPPASLFTHTDTSVCATAPLITLTAPAGYTSYAWSTGGTTAAITVTTTGTYWVNETSACVTQSDTFHVTPSPLPPVNLGHDTAFCSGHSITLQSADGPYSSPTYLWNTGASTPSVNAAATGTYWLDVTVSGCTGSDTVAINVIPAPAAPTVTGQFVYCQNAGEFVPLTVDTSGGNIIKWVVSPGDTSATEPPVNIADTGAYRFYVFQVYSTCPGPVTTGTITVNPRPAPPVLTAPVYCQYYAAPPLRASGTALTWYGPALPTTGTSTSPVPLTNVPGVEDYYVTQSITALSLTCTSDSAADRVSILPQPAPPVTANVSYCQQATALPLTAIGDSLRWYYQGSLIDSAPIPPTNYVPAGSFENITTWQVIQSKDSLGVTCFSDSASLSVSTIYVPQFHLTPSSPFVCQYDSINIAYTGPYLVAPEYAWVLPDGAVIVDGTTLTGMPSIVVQFDSARQSNYVYLTASDSSGKCSAKDSVYINVLAQPYAATYTKNDVCAGDSTTIALSYRSYDADDFTWKIDGTPLESSAAISILYASSNGSGPYGIKWIDTGKHIIQLNSFATQGCASLPFYDTINVHALPNASFIYKTKNESLCIQDSVLFMAIDSNNYSDAYTWGPAAAFNNENSPSSWGKVIESPSIITLTVTDPFGCAANSSMTLDPGSCCQVSFPNAFTPNGDGRNDFFRPIFPDSSTHNFHSFRIANRWGQTIFESESSSPKWDGNYNGVPEDIGVYYYYIKFDCGGNTVEQKGDVTLIR